jgi:glycosyltransferase involved in cell wall biosynthesis
MEIGVFLQESLNIPILLEFHDIEATLRETINAKESVEVLEYTQYISSILADHIICFTDLDKQHLLDRLYVPNDKITLIPNGIREEDFPIMHTDKSQTLVFVGNLFYLPNQESLVYILDKIFPSILEEYPNVEIKVIGMTPNSLIERYQKSININFLGEITNQDIYLKELQSGLIGLSLIFSGSGMNIKNLNYAGAGLAIVTTPLGANGYEHLSSLSIVEPEIDKITDSIKLLLSDEKSTKEKGLSLRDETILWYNWNDISRRHISVLKKISLYNMQDEYKVHTDLRPFWLQEKRVKKGKIEKTIRINL